MPRYYFNVLDGREYLDEQGTDLPGDAAAEREAIRTAGEIIRDGNFVSEEWSMTVVDDSGKVVKTIRFSSGGSNLH